MYAGVPTIEGGAAIGASKAARAWSVASLVFTAAAVVGILVLTGAIHTPLDTTVDFCDENPCSIHGVCVNGAGNYTCNCSAGYSGGLCSSNTCEANPVICKNGAMCTPETSAPYYACECVNGYSAANCTNTVCSTNDGICQNGGVCSFSSAQPYYSCSCASGYSGYNCSATACSLNPGICQNAGTCSFSGTNPYYQCSCLAGYSGYNCSATACSLNPGICQNAGTCSFSSTTPYYSCSCLRGYSGYNCTDTVSNFISFWNTAKTSAGSSASNQIKLPLTSHGTYNFVVQWGDGSIDKITVWNQSKTTHNYSAAGSYYLNITGTLNGLSFKGTGDTQKILNITQWGTLQMGNLGATVLGGITAYNFQSCSNLIITATDTLDLAGTIALSGCFWGCSSITTIPNLNSWNISSVQQLDGLFLQTKINDYVGDWDTSNVIFYE